MNFSSLPELLLSWVKTQGTALLQGNKAEQASPFKVGDQYEGKVLDLLPTGRHLVQVAGQKLDMGLPRNTQAGDSVRLTFVNAGPRPTFLLQQSPVTPVQQVQLSNTAQQVNALLKLAPPLPQAVRPALAATGAQLPSNANPLPVPGNQASIPSAIQTTSGGMAASLKTLAQGASTSVPNGARATTSPVPTPSSTPAPGVAAVTSRGGGASQIAQLLPSSTPISSQAQITPGVGRPIVANVVMLQGYGGTPAMASANTALAGQSVDAMRAAMAASTNLKPTVMADPATPSQNLLPTRLAQTLKESGLFYEAHLVRWAKGRYPFEAILNEPQARMARGGAPMLSLAELGGMPEEAARMAGRQLQMLEGGPFLWQGFAWPGQWMDWLVEERPGGEGDGRPEEQPSAWSTELNLTLPRMGTVNAQLALRGRAVSLNLHVSMAATAEALQNALPELQKGLESAGLEPVQLKVNRVPE